MTCWGEQALSANNVAKVVIGGGNGICFLRLDNTLDCGSVNPYSEGGLIDIFRGPDWYVYGLTATNELKIISPYWSLESWSDIISVVSTDTQICISQTSWFVRCKSMHLNDGDPYYMAHVQWYVAFYDETNIQTHLWSGLDAGCSKWSDNIMHCWDATLRSNYNVPMSLPNITWLDGLYVEDNDIQLFFSQAMFYACGKTGLADTTSHISCGWSFSY